MSAADPTTLDALLVDRLLPMTWEPVPAPSGVDARWRGEGGEVLSLFPPSAATVEEVVAADMAALLTSDTFVPASPFRDGDRLRGHVTDAAGDVMLDATAVPTPSGARRVVLQRPSAVAGQSSRISARASR